MGEGAGKNKPEQTQNQFFYLQEIHQTGQHQGF
jgi:hypothetical protein